MADEQVTIQELISQDIYRYGDIAENSDITSEEGKEAFKNRYVAIDYLLRANKQADENAYNWAKLDLEKQLAEERAKREIKADAIKNILGLVGIVATKGFDVYMQDKSQEFACLMNNHLRTWEESNTLVTTADKSAWKLVEKAGPK